MLAPHAVLLTPAVSLRPVSSRCYKPIAQESTQISFFVFKRLRTLPSSVSRKSCVSHSYENCRVCTNNSHFGTQCSELIPRPTRGMPETTSRIHLSFQPFARCPSRNSFPLRILQFHEGCTPTPTRSNSGKHPDYFLMSSFASRRFSNGCRNGFAASGATLIACVLSFAAVGKSPAFDEIRASARS